MIHPFLVGERIYLRPLSYSDLAGPYLDWFNDEDICKGNSHHVYSYNFEAGKEYIQYSNKTKNELILAISIIENEIHIGNVALQNISFINRSAEFSIIIGDKNYWNKGIGYEVARLILKHAFLSLNLNRIYCGTFADNIGMIKLAESLGMVIEGRRRKAAYKNGDYKDVIEFGLIKDEYILNQRQS